MGVMDNVFCIAAVAQHLITKLDTLAHQCVL